MVSARTSPREGQTIAEACGGEKPGTRSTLEAVSLDQGTFQARLADLTIPKDSNRCGTRW